MSNYGSIQMKKTLTALTLAAATVLTAQAVEAKTLKWAFQGDAQSLDPQSLNETFTLGLLGNIFEGLVRRGPDWPFSRPWRPAGKSSSQNAGALTC